MMPDYLETTIDKFTFRVATDRLYTASGAWVFWLQPQGPNHVRIGLTDFLQQHSGDMAFVSVKPAGTTLSVGDELAELETIKMTMALPSPVSGKVVEVNPALEMTPEIVNQDPYGKGWLAVVECENWEANRMSLLEPQAYFCSMKSQAEEEINQQ